MKRSNSSPIGGCSRALVLAVLLLTAPAAVATPEEHARMLDAVNGFRSDHGLPAVALSETLSGAAQAHAEDLAARGLLDHAGDDGSSLGDRLSRACYLWRTAAENLAAGTPSPVGAVVLWAGSPGHRRNLLLDGVDEIGVGRAVGATGGGRDYWVLVLARGRATDAPCR